MMPRKFNANASERALLVCLLELLVEAEAKLTTIHAYIEGCYGVTVAESPKPERKHRRLDPALGRKRATRGAQ